MESKMRVLVTGGGGLVGHALQDIVQETKHAADWIFLTSRDGDLCNQETCQALFDKHQPTHVIHLAARVGGLFHNMKEPVNFFVDNMKMSMNVLQCAGAGAPTSKVEKVISCLSTCIFPDQPPAYPLTEAMMHAGAPHDSNAGYAHAKRMIDVLNHAYAKQSEEQKKKKTVFTSVTPTNLYGPHDNFDLEDGHVLPALIHKLYLAQKKGEPLVVQGSGKPLRQFLFAKDLARALVWALHHYEQTETIIIAPHSNNKVVDSEVADIDNEVSIQEVVLELIKVARFTGVVVYDESKADGQLRKPASSAKFRDLCPDFVFTPLHEGLQKTWTWFQKHAETARGTALVL